MKYIKSERHLSSKSIKTPRIFRLIVYITWGKKKYRNWYDDYYFFSIVFRICHYTFIRNQFRFQINTWTSDGNSESFLENNQRESTRSKIFLHCSDRICWIESRSKLFWRMQIFEAFSLGYIYPAILENIWNPFKKLIYSKSNWICLCQGELVKYVVKETVKGS